MAYFNLQEYDLSIESLNKVLELEDGYAEAYFQRGNIYLVRKEYQKAVEDYSKVIELQTAGDTVYFNRAVARLHLELIEEAKGDFEKVVEITANEKMLQDAKNALDIIKENTN